MSENYITIFAVMPKEIYKTKKLTPEDKLIAERIVYLCKKEGYSWITNKSLADIYGIKENSVSQHIRNLKKYGFIKCVYGKSNANKSNRVIYLTDNIWDKEHKNGILNNKLEVCSIPIHNNKYNYKNNIKMNSDNLVINYDKDGVMLWNGQRCEAELCSEEEQKELEEMLKSINGDKNK